MNKIFALAGVVIKELYRRKDFYVMFVMTALITLAAGSANFFKDGHGLGQVGRPSDAGKGRNASQMPKATRTLPSTEVKSQR